MVAAVGQLGSLNKAAEKLCLTPSALSHQLRELEQQLGTSVFYRVNNELHFTPAGKELREISADVLPKLEGLKDRIRQIDQDQLRGYVHGFSAEETQRLHDQATSISELLHWDSRWKEGAVILEAGCGVGAQTQIIVKNNPNCDFVAIDLSDKSLSMAKEKMAALEADNVRFERADVTDLPMPDESFDHVFVCFLLEHLQDPDAALREIRRVLRKNGTLTVIEGDHGSTYFYPDSAVARKAIDAQVKLQSQNGGNANIGRSLFPLLQEAGYGEVEVSPRQVYVDDSKPALVEGFTRNTFTAMIKGVKEEAVSQGIISASEMGRGIDDLYRTAQGGGTFCYTFFKATAVKVDK
ncbi:MAG: methyltransferase domain-containing protein [Bacteroidota bacterium]